MMKIREEVWTMFHYVSICSSDVYDDMPDLTRPNCLPSEEVPVRSVTDYGVTSYVATDNGRICVGVDVLDQEPDNAQAVYTLELPTGMALIDQHIDPDPDGLLVMIPVGPAGTYRVRVLREEAPLPSSRYWSGHPAESIIFQLWRSPDD